MRNKKYQENKKNEGHVPLVKDMRTLYVPVGCQKCIECRKQKAREWQIRMLEDIRTNRNGIFTTLTFSNESIAELIEGIPKEIEGYDIDNAIATIAVKRFRERWRKEHGKSVRHWLVTELGDDRYEHLHLHGIIWTNQMIKERTRQEEITKHWQYGYTWMGTYVNEATVNYITKYVSKADEVHREYRPIILTSPGIGGKYIERPDAKRNKYNQEGGTIETYKTRTGHKIAMPTYWRNKIYSDAEREALWIERLEKGERWVCGEKIDIRASEDDYYRSLEWYRKRNKELGYGDDSNRWEQEQYEKARRNLKIQERIHAVRGK